MKGVNRFCLRYCKTQWYYLSLNVSEQLKMVLQDSCEVNREPKLNSKSEHFKNKFFCSGFFESDFSAKMLGCDSILYAVSKQRG